MAVPTSRQEFADYCLRRLGYPVINIEVTPEQVDDCIDEALSYFNDYHFNGTIKLYLKHQVTEDDRNNGWISVPDDLNGVIGVFPIGTSFSTGNMFDIRYQYALNDMVNLGTFSLVDYYMTYTNIAFMSELLVGRQPVRFNKHENKLYIDMNWKKLEIGEYIIVEAYANVNGDDNPDVWGDRWLQKYTIAKIKYQWGTNLSKFQNGMLPGNIQFNAEKIYDEAKEEIRNLEERMQWDAQLPPLDMIG